MILLTVLGSLTFTACGGDDPDPVNTEVTLSVTPTDISLMATQGASASFTVSATHAWVISCDADWINLSSKSGNGNSSVTVTALGDNKSAIERSTTIIVTSGDKTQTVTVKQLPIYQNAVINFTNIYTMCNSAAFDIEYSDKVASFKYGFLSAEANGWSDTRIAEALEGMTTRYPRNDRQSIKAAVGNVLEELSPNTDYYLCALAYDENGQRGPVTKVKFVTSAHSASRPSVSVIYNAFTSSYWDWKLVKGVHASNYYTLGYSTNDLDDFVNLLATPDALIARTILDEIAKGNDNPVEADQVSYRIPRNTSDQYCYCAAFAKNSNGKWSCQLDKNIMDLSYSASPVLMKNVFDDRIKALKDKRMDYNEVVEKIKENFRR